ncbi:P-loop containing nucleoside triphosphate hydrolase protein, partial [Mycena amicta]
MLPSQPKIFHGRETELNTILTLFQQSSPRIAILGPGGMGKTSLAKVVLHHPIIAGLFASSIYFISCESASTVDELATQIALHMNNSVHIDSHSNPRVQLQQQVSLMDRCLLVLDNLETLWEPAETRSDLEEFLSGLSSNLQLAIMITMRGTERPGRVLWSRPFLQPLTPLSDLAARQTFMDIADSESIQDEDALRRLLEISEKMPLAITLLAHLADAEGCEAVTRQWESEKTSLISKGSSKYWNLEFSISLSLSSPRITPGAVELLRLLSILPDGLSDGELRSINLPMAEKSALVRTSLAYVDDNRKLKVLAPIREYMVRLHPPPKELICVLFAYYAEL